MTLQYYVIQRQDDKNTCRTACFPFFQYCGAQEHLLLILEVTSPSREPRAFLNGVLTFIGWLMFQAIIQRGMQEKGDYLE